MQIFIKTALSGKFFTIEIDRSNTVEELKEKALSKVRESGGIPPEESINCRLEFAGKILEDDRTLSDYNIQKESVVYLLSLFRLNVCTPNGTILTVTFDVLSTIGDIKHRINFEEKTPIDQQRLIYAGAQLEDGFTLRDYKIEKDFTIDLVLHVRDSIPIYIKTLAGNTIMLDVVPTDTIEHVKAMIKGKAPDDYHLQPLPYNHHNIKKEADYQLAYNDTILEDYSSRPLSYYNIQRDAILYMTLNLQVHVTNLIGKSFTLDLQPSDTIGSMKTMIQNRVGIPPDEQILRFKSKLLLVDSSFISEEWITHNSCLYLVSQKIPFETPILADRNQVRNQVVHRVGGPLGDHQSSDESVTQGTLEQK